MKFITMLLVAASTGTAAAATPPDQVEFFESKIRPVLVQRCYKCHNSIDEPESGLALDYKAALLAGGGSGKVIVSGKPDESILIRAIRHDDDVKMPLESPKLDDAIIRDFEKWVAMGAPDPRLTKPTKIDREAGTDWQQVRDQRVKWWSFQPLESHVAPMASDPQWNAGAIDRFVYDRMRAERLTPQEPAAPEVLVRRVHLILTGLPPSPEVVKEYVGNPSPRAYEQLVDRLLASKQYGERWARHWMDWYRYAESHGSEGDPRIPYVQQYRDYLIRGLNADVPYDQLLREHLAGDLLGNPRVNKELGINESAIGPAHLRMVPHGFGVTDAYGEQITFTDNQIDVISKAMLGLTVSCARCHDHKFDPISQKDFYRFYGVMVSNRASSVLIDTQEKLDTNKIAIAALKQEVRSGFAEHWLSEIDDLPARMQASSLFRGGLEDRQEPKLPAGYRNLSEAEKRKAQERLKTERAKLATIAATRDTAHPLGAWSTLNDASKSDYPSLIEQQAKDLRRIKDNNAKAKAGAEFYLDLRDQATFDKWYASGNGVGPKVSPAGSFALQADGDKAITGIYPAGIYSHLISDKHAAVLSSGNFFAKGAQTMARVAGVGAQLRVPVRSYPLTHGGLHPTRQLDDRALKWQVATGKWQYWQGEMIHYELRTSKDSIPRPGDSDRSWFGVTEVIAGDDMNLREEGASLLDLVDDASDITDRQSLRVAYTDTLQRVVSRWRDGEMSDQEAEFLDAFVRFEFLANQIDQLPSALQDQIARYRELEMAIPVPTRAPGVLEAEPFDHPLLVRGDYKQESAPVKRQFLEIFSSKPYSDQNSGRLELAEDMVSPANTLKTRVLINRLWAYVFDRGIVASTDNFGRLGEEPTHPELLDYLALDFENNGWSIKRALRQMVISHTFKSASQASSETRERDPQNLYLSYFTPRRLDAEAILDSINHLAGKSPRAVYMPVIRNRLNPFLAAFNAPIPTSTESFRNSTNVPVQSLTMMNGRNVERAARAWFDRIMSRDDMKTPEDRIAAMFMQAYARRATPEELRLCLTHLGPSPNADAYARIALVLLNTKEFIYVY